MALTVVGALSYLGRGAVRGRVGIAGHDEGPSTDPHPQPGAFDVELEALGPEACQWRDGDPTRP